MSRQARTGTVAAFISGVVVGVAGLIFLGGGRDQTTTPAAQASEQKAAQADQREVPQVGRYQPITFLRIPTGDVKEPGGYAGLLDTATGKVWSLQAFGVSPITWKWVPIAEGPK